MKYYWQVTVILIVHAYFSMSTASLFSDECLRNAFDSAYDATTDSCWIAEKTALPFEMAQTRCNHMPGYEGHLGFPKTAAEMNILYKQLLSNDWQGWIGLRHFGLVPSNKTEWFWTYPNGTTVDGSAALWKANNPASNSQYKCSYPLSSGSAIVSTSCSSTLDGFYCQYERKTAHHETTLEHRCKQFNNWFWWEESKSCLLFAYGPNVVARPEYSKLMCTQIPGYRGHLAHVTTMEKSTSIASIFMKINIVLYMWTGLERDANVTTNVLDGLFWRREDGYKVPLNEEEYINHFLLDSVSNRYISLGGFSNLRDWTYADTAAPLCEYQEDLKYAPSPLDMICANLSLPHLYYKGSCYVRVTTPATFAVAKTSCNHIDGFNGHLAVLHNSELLNIIYYTLTSPYSASGPYWLGLERLNTSSANVSAGYYWNTGNGQYFQLADYSAFKSGNPSGVVCGSGNQEYLYATGSCTVKTPYVCEYVEPHKGYHYRIQANFNNKKTIGQAIIKLYDDLYMPEQCGWQCTKELSCRSIAFSAATGICLLQSLDSSAGSSYFQVANGYVWYDRY